MPRALRTLTLLAALTLAACDGSGGPVPDLSGTWTGGVRLGAQSEDRFTTLVLTQQGTDVSGRMTVGATFADRPLTGRVDADGRLVWRLTYDCVLWNGVLTFRDGGPGDLDLTGPLSADHTGCPGGDLRSGTAALTRTGD